MFPGKTKRNQKNINYVKYGGNYDREGRKPKQKYGNQ